LSNKLDLARAIVERHELPRSQAVAIVDELFSDIEESILANDPVRIPGFGIFRVRDRKARIARNPATGEPVKVPAKRVFKFLPAKALKEAIASKRGGRSAKPPSRKAASKKTAPKKAAPKKAAAKKVARKPAKRASRAR
jgi:DNA-binding protein HU-beta